MGFWDLVYFSWFGLIGLGVLAIIGAAIWESSAAKKRLKKAKQPAVTETGLQEEPVLDEQTMATPEEPEAPEADVPAAESAFEEISEEGFEELDEQSFS